MNLMNSAAWTPRDAPSTVAGTNLLQNSQPAARLGILDGNVAAHFQRSVNHYLVTSNATYVPLPADIDTKCIALRVDMRFGHDDPVLWPQFFVPAFPHLAAIPKAPTSAADIAEIGVMWWDPTPSDFVTGMTLTQTLGKLCTARIVELARHVDDLLTRYDKYLDTLPKRTPPTPLFPEIVRSLEMGLERLRLIPTTYKRMCLNVTSVQRQYLELHAMLQFFTVYMPRSRQRNAPARIPDNCVGAFTQDPEVAQSFLSAGLPFWFIRPFIAYSADNILRVVHPICASEMLEMRLASDFPPVPSTSHTEDRLRALMLATRATPWYSNPFARTTKGSSEKKSAILPYDASPRGAGASAAATSLASRSHASATATTKRSNASPYALSHANKRALKGPATPNPTANASRDKYKIFDSDEMPAPIIAWANALTKVDRTHAPLCGIDAPHIYVFPEPALLASTADDNRRRVYYHHYTLLRDALMVRVADPDVPPGLLTTQEWRDLLLGKVVAQGKKGSRVMQRTVRIQEVLAPALKQCGIDAFIDFPVQPEATPPIKLHRAREILWELAEMNWRYEFLGLDARACGLDRADQCRMCFASTALISLDFRDSQQGLASLAIMDRLPYLVKMARLMCDWQVPCSRPREIDNAETTTNWDAAMVLTLERRIATYYTQTFYDFFGRAAVLPMRLEHEFGC